MLAGNGLKNYSSENLKPLQLSLASVLLNSSAVESFILKPFSFHSQRSQLELNYYSG